MPYLYPTNFQPVMNSDTLLIDIKDVNAGYEDKIILNNVTFSVHSNDFIGVIGPNGGGKTTLIKLILGQLTPFKGSISYHNAIINKIGYLPQYNSLDREFPINVHDIVLSGLQSTKGIYGRYTKNDNAIVSALLERCGILEIRNNTIGSISGGELQRSLLCRALISNPHLLILDEPNTYVDNKFEKELYNILKDLNNNMAIIIVSHDLGTITSYVKTIACVNRSLHYHKSNIITQEQLYSYDCPILLVAHGDVPHTILKNH